MQLRIHNVSITQTLIYDVSVPTTAGREPDELARREQILDAARAVIEEYGPDALTGQIAKRAGLARPNVYRHFSSKYELDLAVARRVYQELRHEMRGRLGVCGTPREVIRAPIAVQVDWADRHPNLYRFLVSRGNERISPQGKPPARDFAAELVVTGASYFPGFAANPEAAADLVIAVGGLIDASILAWLRQRTHTQEDLVDRLTTQAWLIIDHHLREVGICLDPAQAVHPFGSAARIGDILT